MIMENDVYAGLTSEVALYSMWLSFVGNSLIKVRVATGKYTRKTQWLDPKRKNRE